MLYLLYGPDSYRRFQRLKALERVYREKNPQALGITVIDEGADLMAIRDALVASGGLFEEKRFIVLRDAYAAHDEKLLETLLATNAAKREDLNAVLVEGDLTKVKTLKKLKDLCRFSEEFMPLSSFELEKWVQTYVDKRGLKEGPRSVEPDAVRALIRLGPDLWRIASELEKLLLFCAGRKSITFADIQQLVSFSQEETIFPLSDGICDRKPERALVALARLTADEDNVDGLIGYVVRESRQLARARFWLDDQIRSPEKVFDVNPHVWKRRVVQAKGWGSDEACALLDRAVNLELSWKTGSEKRLSLEKFILAAA